MSSIDERVVQLMFDNKQWEQGVSTTLSSLDKLNKGLKLEGAAQGITEVSNAAKSISLEGIASGVETIVGKFRTLSIVGITALTNIANRAVSTGLNFVKSFSFEPIKDGLNEYETNLNSIQTILANTGLEGQKGLNKVNQSLNELNTYSDKTIYNFTQMAQNIGTFTAAGVGLKTSTAAIKGIANLAAVSGSNAEQASTAMYQLSQALAAGKVTLQDWNSVVNAGMGGKVFQNAIMETARVHGVAIDKMVKKEGGFRNTLQKGWLTSKILTETLAKFTGDLSEAQLKSMGYSKKQIADIIKMGKTAQDAATKVKTFHQLIDTLKEAVGSGWTRTWQILFGDFDEARSLFTNVSNVIGGFISASSNARNKVLGDWKALGGRTALIKSIANVFHALIDIIKPIKDAFREIFPATTGKQLFALTAALEAFTQKLKIGANTADKIKRTFAGVFAVFGIGWDVLKEVAKTLAHLFGVALGGSGSFLDITAKIGDFLVGIQKAVKQGHGLTDFFKYLGVILAVPIKLVQKLGSYLSSLFDGFDGTKAAKSVASVAAGLNPLQRLVALASAGINKLGEILTSVWKTFQPIAVKIINFFAGIGKYISTSLDGVNFDNLLGTINTGLFAGLVLLVKKFVDKFKSGDEGGLGSIVDVIKESFEELNHTLAAMQQTLKATTLLEIAAAIGILTISVVALSKIDSDGLKKALSALAVMFTQLFASMAVFSKIAGGAGLGKMLLVAGAMILVATAVDTLTIAVTALSKLDWNSLAKGLTGVTVLLASLAGTMKFMPPASGMISTGIGLIALAAAIKILASAVSDLSGLSWQEMAKGLVGVGALLASLTLFTKFAAADKGGVLQGAGIILLAAGIKILASAMKDMGGLSWTAIGKGLTVMAGALALISAALYLISPTALLSAAGVLVVAASLKMIGDALDGMGKMSWKEIGKGLTILAGALTLISAALYVIPPTSLLSAAAILVVAASLSLIGDALKSMAQMSWGEIGKSLVELAGALGIIAGAMILMIPALPGAAALLIVTASLMALTPILETFGQMSWGEIAKGLLTLAGVFAVLGASALVLTPLVPVLLALGAAVTLIGIGMLAAGAGVLLFAAGLTALSVAGAAGTAAMVAMVTGLIGLIPAAAKEIGEGIVVFAKAIELAGPAITKALTVVLLSLISAIGTVTPKIITTLLKLLTMMYQAMAKYVPQMVDAGLKLITGVLNGIAANIGKLITAATNVIVNFLNGISKNLPRVIQAGVNLILAFVNGLAKAIRANSKAMGAAGANLGTAIIDGMVLGLAGGLEKVATEAAHIGKTALDAAKHVLDSHSPSREFIKIGNDVNNGFAIGLKGNRKQINSAFDYLKKLLLELSKSSKASASERAKGSRAYTELTKHLNDERTSLGKLADQYDSLTAKIKNAKSALADAKKTRDDYNKTITDQFDQLPTISTDTTATEYVDDLQKQIEATKEFSNVLQKLRSLGLNDEAYKQLLNAGTNALPLAQQLLDGGKASIDQINSLDKQLDIAAAALGKSASTALYQAAVDSAAGLVKGLEAQQANIEKQMDKIADAMVKAIKKKLGIKSPSKAFSEIGGYSGDGLVEGLRAASSAVEKSAEEMGNRAISSLRNTLSGMSDLISGNIDVRPVISPVLDLSDVKKNAGQLSGILTAQPFRVDGIYSDAAGISNGFLRNQSTENILDKQANLRPVTFNQYNNSPKALSSAEIYRQTNNQLSRAREAVSIK